MCVSAIGQLTWDLQSATWKVGPARKKQKIAPVEDLRVCMICIKCINVRIIELHALLSKICSCLFLIKIFPIKDDYSFNRTTFNEIQFNEHQVKVSKHFVKVDQLINSEL